MNKNRTYIAAVLTSIAIVLASAPLVIGATKSKPQIRQEVQRCENQWNRDRERCNAQNTSVAQKQQCIAAGWSAFESCVEGVEKGLSRTLKKPEGIATTASANANRGTSPARTSQPAKQAGQQAAAAKQNVTTVAGASLVAPKPTPKPTPRSSWIIPGARQTGSHIR